MARLSAAYMPGVEPHAGVGYREATGRRGAAICRKANGSLPFNDSPQRRSLASSTNKPTCLPGE